MDKRGLSYVDWVISMGLFIIVVLAIFIFLKPGAQSVYNNDNLLDIAEVNFLANAGWYMVQIPLFVKKLDKVYQTPTTIIPVKVDVYYSENFVLDVKAVHPDIKVTHLNLSVPRQLTLECKVQTCRDTIQLFFKPLPQTHDREIQLRVVCTPATAGACRVDAGASEFLEGLREGILMEGISQSYPSVKQDWAFPEEKDLAVLVNNRQVLPSPSTPAQASVFVRTRKYWILKDTGERVPAEINVRVW